MNTLAKIRQRCFFGLMLTGGLAGICETHWADQAATFNFFNGLIMVGTSAFLGSFLGFFLKNTLRVLQGRSAYMGQSNDGVVIGSLVGAVLGILLQILTGDQLHTAVGACLGASLGGFAGAFPDEMIPDMLRMLYAQNPQRDRLEPMAPDSLEP
ncbi:MAG: hypothetical protein PHX58_12795 [Desulfovibrio sp.]|nr:hypothetical protein [Desulfovibrio sp.]